MNRKTLLAISVLSTGPIDVYAQVLQTRDVEVVEQAQDPEQLASAIIMFTPTIDMPLHIPLREERVLEGVIDSVEMGPEPRTIIMHADTLIRPLFAGVTVKMYLRREKDQDEVYYPIAILSPEGIKP